MVCIQVIKCYFRGVVQDHYCAQFNVSILITRWAGVATRYGLNGPEIESHEGTRFSAPVQTTSGAHPASCTMDGRSFPGVKWPGHGVGYLPVSNAEVKERVDLYVYSPSRPTRPLLG